MISGWRQRVFCRNWRSIWFKEGTTALIDLFDLAHAKKVLAMFGRAFGKLPANLGGVGKEQ